MPKVHFENLNIIPNTIKKIVSKVCHSDYKRKRQIQIRKKIVKCYQENEPLVVKHIRQRI
jgi:hypothetical protein